MFKIPKNIDGLSLDEKRAILKEARAAGRALVEVDDADIPAADIEQAEKIMAFMEQVQEAIASEEAAIEAAEAAVAAARGAFAEPEEDEDEGDDEEEDAGDGDAEAEEDAEAEADAEPVAVAASAKPAAKAAAKPAAKAAARNAKPPVVPETKKELAVITAAADVPGLTTGEKITDFSGVASALQSRLSRLPKSRIPGGATRNRYGVAQVNLAAAREDGLWQGNPDFKSDHDLVMAAARESRLSGNSLTAAGGWCAPSETLYGFCVEESTDGILDLPSITATRGGIRYTKGPDFSAIYADANLGWDLTEAEVIAEEVKPCLEVECPDFDEVRLNAVGLCIKAGILTDAAYPELVRRYIEAAVIAHQHKVAASVYQTMLAGSIATAASGTQLPATDALGMLEIVAQYERQRKRMAFRATMEVILPVWYKATIRHDLARRNGVEAWNITDQQIDSYFATRQMRVQWVYNTGQDLTDNNGGTPPVAVTVPSEVTAIMYPAGTWVKATTDVISLDAVYDSTNLAVNTYTALFVEEGLAVVNTCGDSVKVPLPTRSNGLSGAANVTSTLWYAPI